MKWIAILCTATLAGCGLADPVVSEAQEAVTRQLRDPDSAQFRNVRRCARPGAAGVEGEVNAKGSAGGYVGFTPFIYVAGDLVFLARDDSLGEFTTFDVARWASVRSRCWSNDQLTAANSM